MNIIQLSEQLKDVPDNFLFTEVQNPTGSYPAYLVLAELTRRKRMRSSAAEEPPQTTVVEDLATPQQPMQSAGLGAFAKPGEMAAQDVGIVPMQQPVMAQPKMQPQMMAGGGLVAFRDGGDVVRAQSGLFLNPTEGPVTFEDELESYRPKGLSRIFGGPQGFGAGNIRYRLSQLGYSNEEIAKMDPAMQRLIVARAEQTQQAPAPVSPQKPPAQEPPPIDTRESGATRGSGVAEGTPSAKSPSGGYMQEIMDMIKGGGATTTSSADRAAGIAALGQALPDTATPLMENIIKQQQEAMAGKKDSNINMALMQAGLGMMGSKGRGLQGVAEGGLSGLKAYREGAAEIQKSEQLMQASQLELAKAQDARSRGLYDLQLKSEQNAAQLAQQAKTAQLQGAQILATLRGQDIGLQAAQARIDARGVGDVTPSPSEMKAAEDIADKRVMELVTQGKIKPGSPEAAAMKQQFIQRILAQSNKVYMPMSTTPETPQFDFRSVMGQ